MSKPSTYFTICVLNESHSVKRDFFESDLGGKNPIVSFLGGWLMM